MVWLDRLLWVLGQGCAGQGCAGQGRVTCVNCVFTYNHTVLTQWLNPLTTVLTQSAAARGLTLLQPNFWTFSLSYTWITCLLNRLWDSKEEIEFEWPYFMIHVV